MIDMIYLWSSPIEHHLDQMIYIKIKLLEYKAATNPIDLVIFMIMFNSLHQTIKLLNARLKCDGLTDILAMHGQMNLKNISILRKKTGQLLFGLFVLFLIYTDHIFTQATFCNKIVDHIICKTLC